MAVDCGVAGSLGSVWGGWGSNPPPKDYETHQRRSVPIPRSLVEQLAEPIAGKGPEDLVFTSPRGAPLRNHNFRRRVFAPAAEFIGVPGLTPHDLRHTAASLAVQAGQRMLGHASAAMTLDVYAGLFGDDLDAVAERLDDAAARPCGLFADSDPSGRGSSVRDRSRKWPLTWAFAWWGGWGSNPRPKDYESSALTG